MKKSVILAAILLSFLNSRAQLKLIEIESILKQDIGVSISEVPIPFIDGKNLKTDKLKTIDNYYGKHSIDSFVSKDGKKSILVFNEPNHRESFLLRITKTEHNLDFGHLYRFSLKSEQNRTASKSAYPYEERGLIVRDKKSGFTFFISVSLKRSQGIDSLTPHANSLFDNEIRSIYLFNANFSLVCIFNFDREHIYINSIAPNPKKLTINSDDKFIRELDHQKLISLFRKSSEEGKPVLDFKIDKEWGMGVD